jgi:elongator complex protein 3
MSLSESETAQLFKKACLEIIEGLLGIPSPTKRDVNRQKVKVCRKYKVKYPSNSELIKYLKPNERSKLLHILKLKPVRAISGINVVTVMTKPQRCPKDEPCIYCPGGLASGTPQSYTGKEPAALRGLQYHFNPYEQVRGRIKQLEAIGHDVSKIELIILGGTITAMPLDYQRNFIKRCLDATNGIESKSLVEAQMLAETSRIRNVGISIETRPDWINESQTNHLIESGVTRVELGVQTIYDDIYELINRGHTIKEVDVATRILKDSGFKTVYHIMPNLFTTYERDLQMFKTLFEDTWFKPDAIKIYPTLVLEGTKLYDLWKEGKYTPYHTKRVIDLIVEVKKIIPKWILIQRIQRDIPSNLILAGVKSSNLRQLVHQTLQQQGIQCRCIRCREVGHRMLKENFTPHLDDVELMVEREKASEGEDLFISFEDTVNEVLIGYLKLRIPSKNTHRLEVTPKVSSIIRELHVFGPMVPVGSHKPNAWQHKGYGEKLIAEAERLSREEYDKDKIIILSALGTKRYYMRFGYRHDGPYMSKKLNFKG